MSVRILIGDCVQRMKELPDNSVDAVVCDPPYHLTSIVKRFGAENAAPAKVGATGAYARASKGFMGQRWDGGDVAFRPETWVEVLRVLKPGGHLVAFSGTRTYHRMAGATEDAGFEVRDMIAWHYGSGFPKSHDVSKAIDRASGAERQCTRPGVVVTGGYGDDWAVNSSSERPRFDKPATDAAREWEGWGTALKPSLEPVCFAQKPLDLRGYCYTLALAITEAVCQLPSLAKDAEPSSPLSLSVSAEGFGSAQWSAVAECNTPGALCDLMATWPSELALPSSLSTASSWLNTLAALWTHASTFTTETASSLTTDLRTLSCLLSKNTPLTIAHAATGKSGSGSVAEPVASLLSALQARLQSILALSALDVATSPEATNSQDGIASEYLCLARKPLSEKSIAANVLKWGTGALNIDACRIGDSGARNNGRQAGTKGIYGHIGATERVDYGMGRWPANLVHDGSDEVVAAFPDAPGQLAPASTNAEQRKTQNVYGALKRGNGRECEASADRRYSDTGATNFAPLPGQRRDDTGSAARFFYCAKATTEERGEGNNHPTVKPVALMRWLVRLVTPKGGTVLDPFMGSGSTALACDAEQFDFIGCELSPEYAAIAESRIRAAAGMFADVKVAA